jgi:hypothetical protein
MHCVEDSIYEITGSSSVDLIGQAKERSEKEELQRIAWKKERESQELKVKNANEEIYKKRQQYIQQQEIDYNASIPFLDKFIWEPLGIIFIGAIAIGIAIATGPIGWIACPIVIYYFHQKEKNETKQRYEDKASALYPYRTIEDIGSYQSLSTKSASTSTKNSLNTSNTNNSNLAKLDGPTIKCPACNHMTKLYEKDRYQNCIVCRHKFTNPFWKPERPLSNTKSLPEIMWRKTQKGLQHKKTNEFIFFSDTLRSVFPTPGYSLKSGRFIKDSEIELENTKN